MDEKNEMRKMNILKNKLTGRLFHMNEQMTTIYYKNVSLQNKLDEIHLKVPLAAKKVKNTGSLNQN